jgi:putative transposase
MCQCVRNLTDEINGFLRDKRYLIHDRDDKFSKKFDQTLRDAGVEPVVLRPRTPDLNAYAERFVLSVKSECLNHVILFGERSLRHVLEQYPAQFPPSWAGKSAFGWEAG